MFQPDIHHFSHLSAVTGSHEAVCMNKGQSLAYFTTKRALQISKNPPPLQRTIH